MHKKNFKILFSFLVILAFLAMLISCNDSYSSMLGDLNNNFIEIGHPKFIPNIGDEDFDEEMMIPQFQYTLQKESSICLSAPKGAVTYEWLIELPNPDSENNSGTSTSRTLITRSVSQSSTLYYTPSNTIKVGILYILTLNATTKEGTVYTDNADIIFYE